MARFSKRRRFSSKKRRFSSKKRRGSFSSRSKRKNRKINTYRMSRGGIRV